MDLLVSLLVAQMVKNPHEMQETRVRSLDQKDSHGEGNGNPLQYSCLENSMDRGAWQASVLGGKDKTERVTLSFFMDFSMPMNTPKIISKICVSGNKGVFLESTQRKKVKKPYDRC